MLRFQYKSKGSLRQTSLHKLGALMDRQEDYRCPDPISLS